jgi:SAM-dependent methyltransferase
MKLNVGATHPSSPGWTTVDMGTADIQHDLSVRPWPFEEDSIDAIVASHILEHFPQEGGVAFLQECHRILKPGGALRIAVPDLDKFIRAHVTGDFAPLGGYHWTDMNYLMGGPPAFELRPEWRHYYAYCYASLAYTLNDVGFVHIARSAFNQPVRPMFLGTDTPEFQHMSLYVECEK